MQLEAREPCHRPLVVLFTIRLSSQRCQNLVSQGSIGPCTPQGAASMHVDRNTFPWAFSKSVGRITSPSGPLLGVAAHTSIWSRSFLRQQADLVHMPGNSLTTYCEMLTTHQLLSETPGPPSTVSSTVPSPNNNLRQPLRDSWGLLSHSVDLDAWCLWVPVPPHRECTQPFSVSRLLQLCHAALLRHHFVRR